MHCTAPEGGLFLGGSGSSREMPHSAAPCCPWLSRPNSRPNFMEPTTPTRGRRETSARKRKAPAEGSGWPGLRSWGAPVRGVRAPWRRPPTYRRRRLRAVPWGTVALLRPPQEAQKGRAHLHGAVVAWWRGPMLRVAAENPYSLRHSAGGQDLPSITSRSCFIRVGPIIITWAVE
jgi:hypothetical protein